MQYNNEKIVFKSFKWFFGRKIVIISQISEHSTYKFKRKNFLIFSKTLFQIAGEGVGVNAQFAGQPAEGNAPGALFQDIGLLFFK